MEIALSPREIQTRIRAGESLDEVARLAGVSPERIGAFAAPVFAERDNATNQAKAAPIRRNGEPVLHRTLGGMVSDRLASRGIDPELVAWDATRGLDRLWTVRASYLSGSAGHEAVFRFDPRGRFSVAANDDARWLIGEGTTARGPQPGRGRATHPDENEPTLDLKHGQISTSPPRLAPSKRTTRGRDDLDYFPAGLTEVDGVYDLTTAGEGDALYDMLSGMSEDSVKIYTGLVSGESKPRQGDADLFSLIEDTITVMAEEFSEPIEPTEPIAAPAQPPAPKKPSTSKKPPAPAPPASTATSEAAPTPAPKRKGRKRASVPTWDEIMFGSPHLPEQR
jgi:cell division septation protein DedD